MRAFVATLTRPFGRVFLTSGFSGFEASEIERVAIDAVVLPAP